MRDLNLEAWENELENDFDPVDINILCHRTEQRSCHGSNQLINPGRL
jgi:hypothetical protein